MSKSISRRLCLASTLLAVAIGTAAAEGADPAFPVEDQVRGQLAEGVRNYRIGRFKQAAADFAAALKLQPDNKLVYDFYLAAGDRLVIDMQERDEMEQVLKDLLRRARIYQRELRHDAAYINLLLAKLDKGEEDRVVATNELVAVGPLAVPHLVAAMDDTPQENRRSYCRVVLTKMGSRAVIPLTEALGTSDQRQLRSIAAILADIGDPRSLPKLKLILGTAGIEETSLAVVRNALSAIQRRARIDSVDGADGLYFSEALRYFRDDAQVRDEAVSNESLAWRWDDKAQGAAKLSAVRVPTYAWNELVAEDLLFKGMAAFPGYAAYQPLLAATLAAEDVETQRRLRVAKEGVNPPRTPEEKADAIAERVKALEEAHLRLRMAGPAHLLRAVEVAINSERYEVASHLMILLQDRDLAQAELMLPSRDKGLSPDKPGSILVNALRHPQKVVRYQAAITLATLDPALAFVGSELVVPLLAEAVGEWGMRVVLVVDPDYRQRNTARELLQAKGFLVYTAQDGFEAIKRLEESPSKDAIVIAGDLLPWLKDAHGATIDVPEQRTATLIAKLRATASTASTPIFVATPEDLKLAAAVAKDLEGKIGPGGLVAKPFDGVDLASKIALALKDAPTPNSNREDSEDISLRAAIALQQPDPARTRFDLASAGEALSITVDARSDALRIEALKALGHAARTPGGAALTALAKRVIDAYTAQDAAQIEANPKLRAAFLYALGQLAPTDPAVVAILAKATKHADAGVRYAAAAAIGHGIGTPDTQLTDYQTQNRIDARAAGAGAQ